MSKVPTGWEAVTLNDVLEKIVGGGTPSRNIPEYFNGNIPWFTVKDLKTLKPSASEEQITEKAIANSSTNLLPAGTIIIATRISLGKAIRPKIQCAINQDLKGIFPIKGINPDFLLHWFYANDKIIREHGSGTTVQGIRLETLCSLPVLLPPENEQTRIVEKLEELLSQLDAGTTELKTAQRKLELYRQSLLKAAVEGSLTADWRQKNKPAESGEQLLERILTERRQRWEAQQLARFEAQGKKPPKDWQKKYQEPVKPDTADLPELPEGWVWASVDQVGKVQLGRQRAPKYHSGANMVPYLRVANVFEDRIDISDVMEMHFSKEDEESYRLSHNDILLNEGQSLELVGRPAIYRNELKRACFTNTLIRYRTEHGLVPEFALTAFRHYMHSGRFRKIAKITTNIAHLGAGRLAEVELPVPSTDEQHVIVEKLEEAFSMTKVIEENIKQLLRQLEAQRQNILRAAFAGELVPQDRNDEPASELLARIQAERDAQPPRKSGRAARRTGASATARKSRARKPKEEP